MPVEDYITSESWLLELLAAHAGEIRMRSLRVQREFDSNFHLRVDPALDKALERLFRFVFSTVPDGCEVYVASARGVSPVAPIGSGILTLRWQVVGDPPQPPRGGIAAIRPIKGGAAFHAASKQAERLARAFADAGWTLELSATNDDCELWASASPD